MVSLHNIIVVGRCSFAMCGAPSRVDADWRRGTATIVVR
jgi:hypothetical protein